jgi:hypothetical protein
MDFLILTDNGKLPSFLAGSIELRELKFKESLLDDLNYPIRTAFGYLGMKFNALNWILRGKVEKKEFL